MTKWIRGNSLSVGFNPEGDQSFFDELNKRREYINEFFFSPKMGTLGNMYFYDTVRTRLRNCNTYDIPADMLFNNFDEWEDWQEKILTLSDIVNLKSVTVLNPEHAKEIKKYRQDLQIGLSIRYWDWGRFPNNAARLKYIAKFPIDVICVSGVYSMHDYDFIKQIHELGIKVKMIANEGCIMGKDYTYSHMDGFTDVLCHENPFSKIACGFVCQKVYAKYPWMRIARANLYKEYLKYYDNAGGIDVIKISARVHPLAETIQQLDYWTSDELTTHLDIAHGTSMDFDISNHYDDFLEWVDMKATSCKCRCHVCNRCKTYWERFHE